MEKTNKIHTSKPKLAKDSPNRAVSYLSQYFPDLDKKLKMVRSKVSEEQYISQSLNLSVILTLFMTLLTALVFIKAYISLLWLIVVVPLLWVMFFLFFMKRVDVQVAHRERLLDKDLLFAGRQLLIEIRGGIPLYDALTHLTVGYDEVSRTIKEIVDKTNLGVPLDVAMEDVAELAPSKPFKRLMLQMVNSIRSGSDLAVGLETILNQLANEQLIEIKAYGQKLNPLGMFYMLMGIILPSLGITLMILFMSFTGNTTGSSLLWASLILVGIIQYIFLTLIESSRPRYEI